jgi:hypothetical protein
MLHNLRQELRVRQQRPRRLKVGQNQMDWKCLQKAISCSLLRFGLRVNKQCLDTRKTTRNVSGSSQKSLNSRTPTLCWGGTGVTSWHEGPVLLSAAFRCLPKPIDTDDGKVLQTIPRPNSIVFKIHYLQIAYHSTIRNVRISSSIAKQSNNRSIDQSIIKLRIIITLQVHNVGRVHLD